MTAPEAPNAAVLGADDRTELMDHVHQAINEGMDRECLDVGEGTDCQFIGDWLFEAGVRPQPSVRAAETIRQIWLVALTDGSGRHITIRQTWPEMAEALDAFVDGAA